jgi:Zn-dependent protease
MELTAVMARVAIVAVPLLAAVVLHEVAHGVVAYACGDPTAARAGRLTLNPLAHVDPVGTLLVPGLLLLMPLLLGTTPFVFGWAKPVPIDPRWFRRPRLDGLLVALAGPGTNLILAVGSAIILGWLAATMTEATPATRFVANLAAQSIVINCVLAVFNMLPIPPLDGGRVLTAVLPEDAARVLNQLERVGIVLVLLVVLNTGILSRLVRPVVAWCYALAGRMAGQGVG